ncbi:MAG: ABC transporter permease [Planctomycetia bacterium]|nr:ABC transporter permease [Planctomycetia bacterium]
MRTLRAFTTLTLLSFRRLFWSIGTLMLLFPLAASGLFITRRHYFSRFDAAGTFDVRSFNDFSGFLLTVFAAFLVPLCALAFGTASLGGDREDRTLLFLLVRPLPRGLILAAKFLATLPLVLGFTCGSFWIYCRLAGPVGQAAYGAYLPAIVFMSVAYAALFLLFSVLFRHPAIAALVYAAFMEVLLGNIPGIIKRVAINYYGRSLMYDAGVEHGLTAPDTQWFDPLSATDARTALLMITIIALALAWFVFRTREYEEQPN